MRLRTADLTDAAFGGQVFDVVVSFDVPALWTAPAPEWDVVRHVLAPDGRVVIVHRLLDETVDISVETAVRELAGARDLHLRAVHRGRTTPDECKALELRLSAP